jgi:putative transposase
MRRLLTGYAVTYNHRHRRHGHLFQNRYKSILCQEDPYLLELVRYIHLNPLRARIIPDSRALKSYAYTGHSVILGNQENSWQDIGFVLDYFDRKVFLGRRKYRKYVEEGVGEGERADLVGVRKLGRGGDRVKGDEQMLGDSDFVMEVLKVSEEEMGRGYRLRVAGYDLEKLATHAAKVSGLKMEDLLRPGRYEKVVVGRSLFCYWAVRELGVSATELAKRIGISQPAVRYSVQRGEKLAREDALDLLPK